MKTGFGVFLVALTAVGASWCGFVLAPALQLGQQKQTVALQSTDVWPQQPVGDAVLGAQVYRANNCAACHTRQIRQTGVVCELTLTSLGAHQAADFKDFLKSLMVVPELVAVSNTLVGSLEGWNGELPKVLYRGVDNGVASTLAGKLKPVGMKTDTRLLLSGPDIARGWGVRQSVAADYLYDQPVQLGNLRAGPDLANIGVRAPDMKLQLQHLYAPKSASKDSTMPAYRFLFELRKIGAAPSPDALNLTGEFAPPAGFEVVPKTDAINLAAYLLSQKANVPLYEAPFTPVTAK
jgi:cbb3-type cytochrome oxidase cytochrome c subunit